jgi:putative ABC transport system permease protein
MMPTPLRLFMARLRAFFGGAAGDRDFEQELAAHLEMATEDNIRAGMTPQDARRQASIRLGAQTSLQSRHRDERGFPVLEDLVQDLRFSARLILKERWFSAAAVAAIALGIGANTVGFTIINTAFIRGFNFERAEELHSVSWRPTRGRRLPSAVPDFEDWRSQSRSFTEMAASSFGALNISDDFAAPEQTQGARVTANLFDVLRQRPLLGRTFAAGEDRREATPVVLIGYDLWTNRFARDPHAVGRILKINGSPATIIGVMPDGMKFPDNSELWLPFIPTDAQLSREVRVLSVFGRLANGVTKEQASTEIDGIAQRLIKANPTLANNVIGGQVETLIERFLNGAAPRMFMVIMGAVIFVLLIACANVANLLLSRAIYRSREVAVRYSLGATRWRIVRQLLIESVVLASLGGVVGLFLASYGVGAFDAAIQTTGAPYWLRFSIDYRVLLYVAGTCVATGVLFGLAPALQVSRENPLETLKEGARGSGNRRGGRLGNVMVVGELALTIVLLCGAGLMLRSFIALYSAPPGFAVEGLTRMRMQLPPSNYATADSRRRFFDQLLPKVEAIPGIQSIAVTTAVPPLDHEEWRVIIAGSAHIDDDRRPFVSTVSVSPRYFETLGVGVTRGRGIESGDRTPGSANVVINQMMADRFFPGEDPLGRQLRFVPRKDEPDAPPQVWRTIVGVVPTFLQGSDNDAFRNAVVYLPFLHTPDRTSSLIVRSALAPASVMAAVRGIVQTIDADQPVFAIETIASLMANERSIYRIIAALFGLLAAIALTLSAVGVYGVIAYAVTQRTQEIGLRMAIGAGRWDVSWMFLKKGLMQLALSLLIGLPAALALGAIAQFRLVEIEPSDPLTMIVITVVMTAVALTACVVPASKAARVDPMTALRSE